MDSLTDVLSLDVELMSLQVEVFGDSEDVRRAFVRSDDRPQSFHLFVMSKVSDPVGATGSR